MRAPSRSADPHRPCRGCLILRGVFVILREAYLPRRKGQEAWKRLLWALLSSQRPRIEYSCVLLFCVYARAAHTHENGESGPHFFESLFCVPSLLIIVVQTDGHLLGHLFVAVTRTHTVFHTPTARRARTPTAPPRPDTGNFFLFQRC